MHEEERKGDTMRWPFQIGLFVLLGNLACGAAVSQPPPAPAVGRLRALLVAVQDYRSPYPTRKDLQAWVNLRSGRDAASMKRALAQYGFRDEDILVLQDLSATRGGRKAPFEGATRKGILDAFEQFLLAPAQPGDVVMLHLSGHGQQVPDRNGDERDGRDESFIPYDFVSGDARLNAGRNLLDDDLQRMLKRLADRMRRDGKVDGNITCVVDSCHSGTIHRGSLIARGRAWNPDVDGAPPRAGSADLPPARGAVTEGEPGPAGSGLQDSGDRPADGYVLLSACQSHESAYEMLGGDGGALTYCLTQAMLSSPRDTSYRELMERVTVQVRANCPMQTPALEGVADQRLFSGVALRRPIYPVVQPGYDPQRGVVRINAGRLHGLTAGSTVRLYRAGSEVDRPENLLGEAAVLSPVEFAECRAELAAGPRGRLTARDLLAARVVLSARNYADERFRVLLEGTADLRQALRMPGVPPEHDALELVEGRRGEGSAGRSYHACVVREAGAEGGRGRLAVYHNNNTLLMRLPEEPASAARIRQALQTLWRRRFFYDLEVKQPAGAAPLETVLRVVPSRPDPLVEQGRVVLEQGERFRFEIQNRAPSRLHVYLVNVQPPDEKWPEGRLSLLFPHPSVPDSNVIEPGATVKLPEYEVTEPLGTDVFKLVAATQPLPLDSLLFDPEEAPARAPTARGAAAGVGGPLGPLAMLMLNTSVRARAAAPVPTGGWGVATQVILTRPRAR